MPPCGMVESLNFQFMATSFVVDIKIFGRLNGVYMYNNPAYYQAQNNMVLLIVDCAFDSETGKMYVYEAQPLQESDLALHAKSVKTYHEVTEQLYKICLDQLFGQNKYYYQQRIPPHILTCRKDLKITSASPTFAIDLDTYDEEASSKATYRNTFHNIECRFSETEKSMQRTLFYLKLPQATREAILPRFKIYCKLDNDLANEEIVQNIIQNAQNSKTGIVFKCSDGTAGQGNVFLNSKKEVTPETVRHVLGQLAPGQLFNVEETVQVKDSPPYFTYRLLMAYAPENIQTKTKEFFRVTLHSGEKTSAFDSHSSAKQPLFFSEQPVPYLSENRVKIEPLRLLSEPNDKFYKDFTAQNLKLVAQEIFNTDYAYLQKQLLENPEIDKIIHKSAKARLLEMCSVGIVYGTQYYQPQQQIKKPIYYSSFIKLIDTNKPFGFNQVFFANDLYFRLSSIANKYSDCLPELGLLTDTHGMLLLDANKELYKALLDNILENGLEFTITKETLEGLTFIANIFNNFKREDLETRYLNVNLSHVQDFKKHHPSSLYAQAIALQESQKTGLIPKELGKEREQIIDVINSHENTIENYKEDILYLEEQILTASQSEQTIQIKQQLQEWLSIKKQKTEKIEELKQGVIEQQKKAALITEQMGILEVYKRTENSLKKLDEAKERFVKFVQNCDPQVLNALLLPPVTTMLKNACCKAEHVKIFGANNTREMKKNIREKLAQQLKAIPPTLNESEVEEEITLTVQQVMRVLAAYAKKNGYEVNNIGKFKKELKKEFLKKQDGVSVAIYKLLESNSKNLSDALAKYNVNDPQVLPYFVKTLYEHLIVKNETMEASFLSAERAFIACNMAAIVVKKLDSKNGDLEVLREYFEILLSQDVNLYVKIVSALKVDQKGTVIFAPEISTSMKYLAQDIEKDRNDWMGLKLPLTMSSMKCEDFFCNACSMQRYMRYFKPEALMTRQVVETLGQAIAERLFTRNMSAARAKDAEKIKQHLATKILPKLLGKDPDCLKGFDKIDLSEIVGDIVHHDTIAQIYYNTTNYTVLGLVSGGIQLDEKKLAAATSKIIEKLGEKLNMLPAKFHSSQNLL
jgi:hypothetical protein